MVACYSVVAAWESGDLAGAAQECQAIVDWSERYDAAGEADVCSLEQYEEKRSNDEGD